MSQKEFAVNYAIEHHGLTVSLLQEWLECKQKAKLSIERWTETRKGGGLLFGTLFHECLFSIYSHFEEHKERPTAKEVTRFLGRAKEEAIEKGRLFVAEEERDEMLAQLETLLPAYMERWKEDFSGKRKWIKLERSFSESVGGLPFRGRMDAVFEIGGKPWLLESKTASIISEEALLVTLPGNLQTNLYLLILWLKLNEGRGDRKPILPGGVIYNVVRRPGLRRKKKEAYSEFAKRIAQDVRGKPEHYFHRWEISFSNDDISKFYNEISRLVEDFRRWYAQRMPATKIGMPCINKFGMCKYARLCHEGSSQGLRQEPKRWFDPSKPKEVNK